jgi:hypothetical protein
MKKTNLPKTAHRPPDVGYTGPMGRAERARHGAIARWSGGVALFLAGAAATYAHHDDIGRTVIFALLASAAFALAGRNVRLLLAARLTRPGPAHNARPAPARRPAPAQGRSRVPPSAAKA